MNKFDKLYNLIMEDWDGDGFFCQDSDDIPEPIEVDCRPPHWTACYKWVQEQIEQFIKKYFGPYGITYRRNKYGFKFLEPEEKLKEPKVRGCQWGSELGHWLWDLVKILEKQKVNTYEAATPIIEEYIKNRAD